MFTLPAELRLHRQLISQGPRELLDFSANRATGVARAMFPKQELKRHLPHGLEERLRAAMR